MLITEIRHYYCNQLVTAYLYVESEVHDVAVLNDILFAFDAHFAGLFASRFRAESNVIVVLDNFGAYKAFFKVGVNNAGALGGFASLVVGPSTHFLYSCGNVGFEIE